MIQRLPLYNRSIKAFTLVELMISISIIAILTIAAIPTFSGFSRSQVLAQAFKSLKSDLRVAQSRSLSGATVSGNAKAWGIHFDNGASQYQIIACSPAEDPSKYSEYLYSHARCGGGSPYKTVPLGSQVKINGFTPAGGSLDIVFDSQNGSIYAQGIQQAASVSLSYTDGTGTQTVTITSGGGISD